MLTPEFLKQFEDELSKFILPELSEVAMLFLRGKLILAHQMGRNEVLEEEMEKFRERFAYVPPKKCDCGFFGTHSITCKNDRT